MIEQPGRFHLGYRYDTATGQRTEEPVLLGMRDWMAGVICLGASGAGKTDLCARALEEVLLQAIPAIVLDTRGDLASRSFNTVGARSRVLADRAVFRVYTPGSTAGLAVNALHSLHPPTALGDLTWARHTNVLREYAALVVSGLLALAGVEPATGQDGEHERREHILLATIFESAWRAGLPLDLELLIRMIQNPPVQRIGAFDLNTFYPRSERASLTLALSRLAASPALGAWQQGEPLDIAALLQPLRNGGTNPAGRTRANIFNLAPLRDAERHFLVMVLLAHLLLWARTHAATSVLHCLFCIDGADGLYLPTAGHDPAGTAADAPAAGVSATRVTSTSTALSTVLHQGGTAGVGMLLTARDPSGLDLGKLKGIYTGTYLVGHYPEASWCTRVLENLKAAGAPIEPDELLPLVSRMPPRVFLAASAANERRVSDAVRPFVL